MQKKIRVRPTLLRGQGEWRIHPLVFRAVPREVHQIQEEEHSPTEELDNVTWTLCRNPDCFNFCKPALHPRSRTPDVCGICGSRVETLYSDAYWLERGMKPRGVDADG